MEDTKRTIEKWLAWIPLNIAGGLGVFFVVTQAGSIALVLFMYASNALGMQQSSISIVVIRQLFGIIGILMGAVYAGWLAKEDGKRQGLVVAMIVVALNALAMIIQMWRTLALSRTMGATASTPFGIPTGMTILVSWALMIIFGWIGGGYGEQLTRAKAEVTE